MTPCAKISKAHFWGFVHRCERTTEGCCRSFCFDLTFPRGRKSYLNFSVNAAIILRRGDNAVILTSVNRGEHFLFLWFLGKFFRR